MEFSIQTNVNSLVAQENLRVNGDFQSRTIQRLTSGYRINSSGDDAAGLAVANKFRSDTAELTQGIRNANDGVSQLQIILRKLADKGYAGPLSVELFLPKFQQGDPYEVAREIKQKCETVMRRARVM